MKFASCNLHRKTPEPEDRSSPKSHPVLLSMRLTGFLLHCGARGWWSFWWTISCAASGELVLKVHGSVCCVSGELLQFLPS